MKHMALALLLSALAATAAARGLDTITLDCVFEHQSCINIVKGKPISDNSAQRPMLTTITGLNAKGSATLVGNLGSVPLTFYTDGIRWMFIQVTDTGNVTVTSMPDPSDSGEAYAVHSRHIWILGEGVLSQWAGRWPCSSRRPRS